MENIEKKKNINLSTADLAVLVRNKRKTLGLTVAEVARQSYISAPTIRKIEEGRKNISIGVRVDILRWLGRL